MHYQCSHSYILMLRVVSLAVGCRGLELRRAVGYEGTKQARCPNRKRLLLRQKQPVTQTPPIQSASSSQAAPDQATRCRMVVLMFGSRLMHMGVLWRGKVSYRRAFIGRCPSATCLLFATCLLLACCATRRLYSITTSFARVYTARQYMGKTLTRTFVRSI